MAPTSTGTVLATHVPALAIDITVFAIDPVGFVAVFGVLLVAAILVAAAFRVRVARIRARHGSAYEHDPDELTNCPDCGSRTPRDRHDCEYCGVALPGAGSAGQK